jgi:hypothetical protein
MERRYIARVVGVRPEIVETRTDYLVAVPRSRRAFLVTMSPMAEAVVGHRTALAVIRKARENDVPVFGDGRCVVYVFNDAWESEALVERAAHVVAESQLSGLVLELRAYSGLVRGLRAVWGWLCGLIALRPDVVIPDAEPAEIQPANAAGQAGSGEAPERVIAGAESEDRAPV